MSEACPSLYALLVGIDLYANSTIPPLSACVNDVDAMDQLLSDRFGVPPANIGKLTNADATRQAIMDGFRTWLLAPARSWGEGSRGDPPPAFLFYFSGHGSQAPDPTGLEPDGLDETIVPHDGRTQGVYDIKDWELGALLEELTALSDNVTVVLDCCHSGSGVRAIAPDILPARCCDPDPRPQPEGRPARAANTRGAATSSGWLPAERFVLLSACQDRQLAYEIAVGDEAGGRHPQGALSYWLIKELAQMSAERSLTYRELHERVSAQVKAQVQSQTPQCEGDRDRTVFGGLRPQHDAWLTVIETSSGLVWVNGGLAHGLAAGAVLDVYPPGSRRLADAGARLAELTVQSAGAARSGCTITAGAAAVPDQAVARIAHLDPSIRRFQVIIDVPDHARRRDLRTCLGQGTLTNYVAEASPAMSADFRIALDHDQFVLQDGIGQPLIAPYPVDQIGELTADLIHLVTYRNALALSNPAGDSALSGAVSLAIKRRIVDPVNQRPGTADIALTGGGELVIPAGQEVVLEIANHSPQPLYVALFEFGYAWDIVQWYPAVSGAHEALAPGRSLFIGLGPDERVAFELPAALIAVNETFKVIATTADADFDILALGPLKTPLPDRSQATRALRASPLDQLLDLAVENRPETRAALRRFPSSLKDQWTTVQLAFRVAPAPADG